MAESFKESAWAPHKKKLLRRGNGEGMVSTERFRRKLQFVPCAESLAGELGTFGGGGWGCQSCQQGGFCSGVSQAQDVTPPLQNRVGISLLLLLLLLLLPLYHIFSWVGVKGGGC